MPCNEFARIWNNFRKRYVKNLLPALGLLRRTTDLSSSERIFNPGLIVEATSWNICGAFVDIQGRRNGKWTNCAGIMFDRRASNYTSTYVLPGCTSLDSLRRVDIRV